MTGVDADPSHNATTQEPSASASQRTDVAHRTIRLPVSRPRALERAVFRLAPGLLLMFIALQVVRGLQFQPSAVRNRITDYSLAIVMAPVIVAGLALIWTGGRWLVASLWPGRLDIVAEQGALDFRLGPFGRRVYPPEEIDVRYLFEMSGDFGDDEDDIYESLQPPEEQQARYLPRIRHTHTNERLDQRIMHYVRMGERNAADALRPFIDAHRRDRPPAG